MLDAHTAKIRLFMPLAAVLASLGACGNDTAGSTGAAQASVGDATLSIDGETRTMDYVACSTGADRPFVITFAGDDIKRDDYVNVTMYVNPEGPLQFDTTIVWENGDTGRVWKQVDGVSELAGSTFLAEGTLAGERKLYGEDGREQRTPLGKESVFSLRVECRS